MRNLLFSFLMILMASITSAQITGETETGSDGKGESFFSQYIFVDIENFNVLTRYFWVNNILQRGEFAIGPTLKLGDVVVKPQFGGTTDKQVTVAALVIANLIGHDVVYIGDSKLTKAKNKSYEFYQKLFVGLTKSGLLQFRYEDLLVGNQHIFARIGLEGRYKLSEVRHLYVAPFYDTIRDAWGGQFGLRF